MSTNGSGTEEATTQHGTLAAALLAVQGEVPAVEPDATNPHFKSKFVSLGNLISKVRPVLNRHGISFAQFPSTGEQGQPTLVTILMHESGERFEYAAPLSPTKNDPQGQGSAITYMRRYALASALGVCDQEDDDGGKPSGSKSAKAEELPVEQVDRIKALLKGRNWSEIELVMGSVGADAPKVRRADSLAKAIREMDPEHAESLEKVLADG